jgi:hypothetical protein
MLLFAMTAADWGIIIGAVFVGLTGLATLILSYKERVRAAEREDARILREEAAALKVEGVRVQAQRAASKVEVVAEKTEEVAQALVQSKEETGAKLDEGLKIQRATHTLVNLKTSKQLTTIRDDKQQIVDLVRDRADPNALKVAETALATAKADLDDHLAQQAKVDAEYGTEAATKMGTKI